MADLLAKAVPVRGPKCSAIDFALETFELLRSPSRKAFRSAGQMTCRGQKLDSNLNSAA